MRSTRLELQFEGRDLCKRAGGVFPHAPVRVLLNALWMLSAVSAPHIAFANDTILIRTYVTTGSATQGEVTSDTTALNDIAPYVAFMVKSLDSSALRSDKQLAGQVEARLSRRVSKLVDVNQMQARVELGRRRFIEGEYRRAIASLGKATKKLGAHTWAMADSPVLRDTYHRALLYLAHAHLRTSERRTAAKVLRSVVRLFPDRSVSLSTFGPELVRYYRRIRRKLSRKKTSRLTVRSDMAGVSVFLEGRRIGRAPVSVDGLHPGKYSLYLRSDDQPGRLYSVRVDGRDKVIDATPALDRRLRTQPHVALVYPTKKDQQTRLQADAKALARIVQAKRVIVMSASRYRGRRALQGTVIRLGERRPVRAGLVALEPEAPSPDALQALGQFLVVGKGYGSGVIERGQVRRVSLVPSENDRSRTLRARSSNFFSARVWKWITLGLGGVALGTGIGLFVLDGQGTCSETICPKQYNTFAPALALTLTGGALVAGSAMLFVLDASDSAASTSRSGTTLVVPLLGREFAGLGTSFRF